MRGRLDAFAQNNHKPPVEIVRRGVIQIDARAANDFGQPQLVPFRLTGDRLLLIGRAVDVIDDHQIRIGRRVKAIIAMPLPTKRDRAVRLVLEGVFLKSVDWAVLGASLVFIVVYGVWKGRGSRDVKGYILSNRDMKWYTIALSVMATQASAITFLSTPGQAFTDGMRFIQFYFGLPLAMIVLCITAVPLYHRRNVYTAYEFLERKFDLKTRLLAAGLFLVQRGLAAGLTIYAPSIILSTLLGWDMYLTNLVMGGLVIVYTASGGSPVSHSRTDSISAPPGWPPRAPRGPRRGR